MNRMDYKLIIQIIFLINLLYIMVDLGTIIKNITKLKLLKFENYLKFKF